MNHYSIAVQLPQDTPMTLQQMLRAAVAARDHGGDAGIEAGAVSRASGQAAEAFVTPDGADVYVMDAYKGVGADGAVVAGGLVGADFTAVPGGGVLLADGETRHYQGGVSLSSRVFYQNTLANLTLYVDLVLR